jgi:RNA polymerase sigma-70 factor (ECF subfamily)
MTDFGRMLEAEIPRLRRYARALTRNLSSADDLVQSCLVRAVAKQHLWQPGTDLRAWLFTILHNQHVNDVRRSVREGANVSIEDAAPVLTVRSNAVEVLQLRDLEIALGKLAPEQRQVILLVGLEGMSYEEVAAGPGHPDRHGALAPVARARSAAQADGGRGRSQHPGRRDRSRRRRTGRPRQPSWAGRLVHCAA